MKVLRLVTAAFVVPALALADVPPSRPATPAATATPAPVEPQTELTPEAAQDAAIVAGLKHIRDGEFDTWIKDYCSKEKKCFNEQASTALKRYSLPAMQRRAPKCLRDGDTIKVVRRDKVTETETKVFVACEETAMPVPFWLIFEGRVWKFSNI